MCDYDYALLVLYVIDIMCYWYYLHFLLYVIYITCDIMSDYDYV